MTNLEAFVQEYCRIIKQLPGVTWVEFIGSIARGDYVPGSSDLDIFVHGQKIPRQSKKQALALLRELNNKYGLSLERAPYQHPTPFFIDSPLRRMLYGLLKGRMEARWLRAVVKRIAPSYGLIWRLEQR